MTNTGRYGHGKNNRIRQSEHHEASGREVFPRSAKAQESNPVAQALLKMLENQEPVRTCQLMSELSTLAEEEKAHETTDE